MHGTARGRPGNCSRLLDFYRGPRALISGGKGERQFSCRQQHDTHRRDEDLTFVHRLRVQGVREVAVLAVRELSQQLRCGAGLLRRKRPALGAGLEESSQIVGSIAAMQ